MAADAGGGAARAAYHRGRPRPGKVYGLGVGHAEASGVAALPLEPPRALPLFRDRRPPLPRHRRGNLRPVRGDAPDKRVFRPGADRAVKRRGALHDRRPGGRPPLS